MEDLKDETPGQRDRAATASAEPRRAVDDSDIVPPRKARAADDSDIAPPRNRSSIGGPGVEPEEEQGRQMFDKRLLRRRHKEEFMENLSSWREQHLQDNSNQSSEAAPSRVRVCVRKRPLFDHEVQADEFDVISVRDAEVVVHNCLTKADLRSLFVSHMGFPFSRAFGSETADDEVYAQCAAPAVDHVLKMGVATIFMFGQTGSGKTHTMRGLLNRTVSHLFKGISARGSEQPPVLSLTAFEIAGKNIRDLLDASGLPKEVKVLEGKDHRTRVLGVNTREANSASDLLSHLSQAATQRTTRSTEKNDTSSRSHAVYRIWLGSAGAVLTMVDCAGSERREDTTDHDVVRRKDAAEINSTIFALKECFRAMCSTRSEGQPPYRNSLLTRVLSDSFASEHAHIMAIGTVSPSASDTEHSIGTLRALQDLQGTQMSYEAREDVTKPKVQEEVPHPRNWSEEDVRQWVEAALNGRAQTHAAALKKGTDGKNLVRWPMTRFTQLCDGDDDLGSRLYQDLRHQIKRAGA